MANSNSIFYKIGALVNSKLKGFIKTTSLSGDVLDAYADSIDIMGSVELGVVAYKDASNDLSSATSIRFLGLDTTVSGSFELATITTTGANTVNYAAGVLTIDIDPNTNTTYWTSSPTVGQFIDWVNAQTNANTIKLAIGGTTADRDQLLDVTEINKSAGAFNTGGQDTAVRNNLTVGKNLTVSGDLQVDGTTTTVNSATLTVDDNIIAVSSGASLTTHDTKDPGVYFERTLSATSTAQENGVFIFDETDDKFKIGTTTGTATDTNITVTDNSGTLQVGTLEVYDSTSASPAYLVLGDLDDFTTGLG